jgi:hypothetical protein
MHCLRRLSLPLKLRHPRKHPVLIGHQSVFVSLWETKLHVDTKTGKIIALYILGRT